MRAIVVWEEMRIWGDWFEVLAMTRYLFIVVLISYGCRISDHEFNILKQHPFIGSQFWLQSTKAWAGSLLSSHSKVRSRCWLG